MVETLTAKYDPVPNRRAIVLVQSVASLRSVKNLHLIEITSTSLLKASNKMASQNTLKKCRKKSMKDTPIHKRQI